MKFDIAEQLFRYFISCLAVKGEEHGLSEGLLHELLYYSKMFTYERSQVAGRGTEAEGDGQFQKVTYMEIAEVGLNGIQKHNILFAPFEEARLVDTVLDRPIEDFAQEHGHGVLEDIATYAQQRIFCRKVASGIKSRF